MPEWISISYQLISHFVHKLMIIFSENIFNKHAFKLMYSMQDQVNKSNITVLIIND